MKREKKYTPGDLDSLVAELNQSKAELAHAQTEIKTMLDNIDEILVSLEATSMRVLQISHTCEKVLGYKQEELINAIDGFKKFVHPDDRKLLDHNYSELVTGTQLRKQCRVIHRDGSIRWIELKYMPVKVNHNGPLRLNGMIKDITKAKKTNKALMESEFLFRQFFDRAHEAIVVMDLETGLISDYNQTALLLFKHSGSEMLTQTPESISPEYQPDGVLSAVKAADLIERTTKGERPVLEWMIRNSEGLIIPCEVRLSLISAYGRQLIRASIVDISERKKAEAEVIALNESLERKVKERTAELVAANSQLEAFSYTVSHDLQSPLRIICGYSSLLLEEYHGAIDDNGLEMLRIIDRSGHHMSQLIRDLLAFAKLGGAQCNKTETDMDMLVQSLIYDITHDTEKSKATFKIKHLGTANCDRNLIRQVWINLISNAVKYSSKKDKPLIEIGSTVDNGLVTYYIHDNGAGFDMKYAGKLFVAFNRMHGNEYEGTGIGLASVSNIINRHGGRIWADATPGEGATFYFTLS